MQVQTPNQGNVTLKNGNGDGQESSTVTNPISEINETENMQPSGSKGGMSIGISASNNDNWD